MKKYTLVIGATLLAGSLAWGSIEYQHSRDSDSKMKQYETYLSNEVTHNEVKISANVLSFSDYITATIMTKKVDDKTRSMVVGQLYELMDTVQQTEELAGDMNVLDSTPQPYLTANTVYSIGKYLTNLDSSKTLSEQDIQKLQTIQTLVAEWKKVVDRNLSDLSTEEGFNAFVQKNQKTIVTKSVWKDVINGMEKSTSNVMKEKKIDSFDTYLSGEKSVTKGE